MNDLYRNYLDCFNRGLVVDQTGDYQYTVSSHSRPGHSHSVHYDGTGLPLCNCEATGACSHMAAVCAFVHSGIQRAWDQRRIYEAKHLQLQIRQGKANPRRIPKVRLAMNDINQRHPVTTRPPVCARCGLVPADDLCASCCRVLLKIWPDSLEFARELEAEDQDEAMRLKLGVGE